jgi:hypothetical protein
MAHINEPEVNCDLRLRASTSKRDALLAASAASHRRSVLLTLFGK